MIASQGPNTHVIQMDDYQNDLPRIKQENLDFFKDANTPKLILKARNKARERLTFAYQCHTQKLFVKMMNRQEQLPIFVFPYHIIQTGESIKAWNNVTQAQIILD